MRDGSNGAGASQGRPLRATMRRTSEKPLECSARGGQAERDVADFQSGARQQAAALGGADGKAGQIVVALGVEAGHFGRFAADQGAAGFDAAGRDALDDFGADRRIELAGREIIEEEQRLGALHDDDR